MIQPTRWLEDKHTPAEIRELIRAGSRPPHFPRVALLAAIVPLAQKTALASTWSLPATAIVALKATSVGLVIGLGSIATVTAISGPDRAKVGMVQTVPVSRTATPAVPRSVEVREGSAVLPEVLSVEEPPASATGVASVTAQPTGIAAEAQLLERARSLLEESPLRALMLTNEHRDRFVKGQMAAERELIAIDALLRLGRQREAHERAKPLLSDGASQVFAQRLRNLLDRQGK